MKCAIIRPRCEGFVWECEEPLGAEAIVGFLREHGIASRLFDRRIGASVREIRDYEPDAVGFSLMTQEDAPDALRLLQQLKTPERIFFAGGLFVTTEPARCRALFPKSTYLIRGEGEGPVLSLLTGRKVPSPGPDGWSFASRDDLSVYLAGGGAIHLRGSRGCRGNCAFCTTPGLFHGHHETRSISLLVREMVQIASKRHLPVFNFTDDEFGDLDRVEELIFELKRQSLKAAFSLELRPSVVCQGTPALWERLHQGGLCRIFTGLENLDPKTLRRWHKPTDPQKLLQAVSVCEDSGILCETGYILFHDHSRADTVRSQVRALHSLGRFTPKVALSILHLYPGSELHALAFPAKAHGATGPHSCTSSLKDPAGYEGPSRSFPSDSPLRSTSETGCAAPAALLPDAALLYETWSGLLGECCRTWSECAARLPNAACRAFLTGDSREKDLLLGTLRSINDRSYEIVEGPSSAASKSTY